MSDLTNNWFYPSAERIWLCICLNNAGKYCDRSTYRKCRFWQKKMHLFRWSSFWSCKKAKVSHLGQRKPARTPWKADASKKRHCLVRILVQRHNCAIFSLKKSNERPLESMAIVIGPCWTNFCSQKLKKRILATISFNRTALRATQPKLHSMFSALFLKITLAAAELMSFGYLGAAIWHRWTIICGVPSNICITPTSQRQLTSLKRQYS